MTTSAIPPITVGAAALIDSLVLRAPTVTVDAAAAAPALVTPPSAEPPAPTPSSAPTVEAAVQTAAITQDGWASLLADLSAALRSPDLPAPIQAAAARVLGFQVPLDPVPTAADLRQAVTRSGLFLEARIATVGAPPGDDFKAALLDLQQALEAWAPAAATLAAKPETTPPSPPYAAGPIRGQPAQPSSLPPNAPVEMIAARLIKQTGAAIARQVLMQAASTPNSPRTTGDAQTAQWLFEIPLVTPQGAAIAQFEIDRDGASAAQGETQPVWRARFSLDVDPMGPVHAKITMSGGRARVVLWAENSQTVARLSQQRDDLSNALLGDDLVAQVDVLSGGPAAAVAAAGRFMDKAV